MNGKLYLLPGSLGSENVDVFLPGEVKERIKNLTFFIVENVRTTRRFLKLIDKDIVIDDLHFYELNKHTDRKFIGEYLNPCKDGHDIGLISEAGMPAIADPGSDVVSIAHQNGIKVVPLTGPSSMFLALAASGMNGQRFTFHGYLPVKDNERLKKLKEIEKDVVRTKYTHLFIEAPYRNDKMLDFIIKNGLPEMKLAIACDITLPEEIILSMKIREWKNYKKPELHKRPTVFLLGI